MTSLPTSWLYPGKEGKSLIRLKSLSRDSLYHSFLNLVYPSYQTIADLNTKFLYINRLKMSMISHDEKLREPIRLQEDDTILKSLSSIFEINIYVLECYTKETIIDSVYKHSDSSPTILIEKCNIFNPIGVLYKNGIHTMFFEDIDDEVLRSLEVFDRSGLSEEFEEKDEETKFKIDIKHLVMYDIKDVLKNIRLK